MQKLSQGLYPPLETQVVGILIERISMDREFALLHIDGREIIIYIDAIVSVEAGEEWTEIDCINGKSLCVDESYGEVLEKISI